MLEQNKKEKTKNIQEINILIISPRISLYNLNNCYVQKEI